MDVYHLKNAFLIGVFMAFMIGPVFFMLLKISVLKGARAALIFDSGVILGDITFMLIAYFGSRSILEKIKDDPRLFLAGGFILCVYGLVTYFDKKNKKSSEEEIALSKHNNYVKLFLNGYLLNFLNVGVLAGWLGIMVVIGPRLQMNPVSIFWYFFVIIIGYLITDLGKIFLAKKLRSKLTPLIIYRIKKGMGILLVVFGLFLMLKAAIPQEKMNSFFTSYF